MSKVSRRAQAVAGIDPDWAKHLDYITRAVDPSWYDEDDFADFIRLVELYPGRYWHLSLVPRIGGQPKTRFTPGGGSYDSEFGEVREGLFATSDPQAWGFMFDDYHIRQRGMAPSSVKGVVYKLDLSALTPGREYRAMFAPVGHEVRIDSPERATILGHSDLATATAEAKGWFARRPGVEQLEQWWETQQ